MAGASRKRLARFVADELQQGGNPRELMQQVAAYLVEHKRPHDAEFVMSDIAVELAARGKRGMATVTTARPLSAAERESVKAFAAKKMAVSSVELTEQVDKSLIGGIIIETPDTRYDRSLRRGIEQLTSV